MRDCYIRETNKSKLKCNNILKLSEIKTKKLKLIIFLGQVAKNKTTNKQNNSH